MHQTPPDIAFRPLIIDLQRPAIPAGTEPCWPYPLPAAEMLTRYGLRCLTPVESRVFPGLLLVLNVFKARITTPPAAVPMARAGWVVWVAETYPGCYLVRLPGGATLPAPYNGMAWTAVGPDEPVTTPAIARALVRQQQWRQTAVRRLRQSLRLPKDG